MKSVLDDHNMPVVSPNDVGLLLLCLHIVITFSYKCLDRYISFFNVSGFYFQMLMALVLGLLSMFLMWNLLNGHSLYRIMMIFLVSSSIISFLVTYHRMCKVRLLQSGFIVFH
jgi:hypothetical protein